MDARSYSARINQVYWAISLAIVFVGVVTVVAMKSPTVRAAILKRSVRSELPNLDLSHDPEINRTIRLPENDAFGRKLRPTARTLIVYAGPCSECTKRSFKPASIFGEFDSMIVIFDADPRLLPREYKNFPPTISIIADPKSEYAAILNAQWFPRLYLVDSDSKLVSLQKDPATLPHFVTRMDP